MVFSPLWFTALSDCVSRDKRVIAHAPNVERKWVVITAEIVIFYQHKRLYYDRLSKKWSSTTQFSECFLSL